MSEVGGSEGPATDRHNEPVIDPTKNVLDLVKAAIQRQDDLRIVEMKHLSDQIAGVKDLTNTRFQAITDQLSIIESRRVEQKIDTKVAVDAALSAAEKAVKEQTTASEKAITKSETSAAEQSKQQNATFTAALKGISDLMTDLKDRVIKIESRKEGSGDLTKTMIAVAGLVLTVLLVLVGLAAATHGFTQ